MVGIDGDQIFSQGNLAAPHTAQPHRHNHRQHTAHITADYLCTTNQFALLTIVVMIASHTMQPSGIVHGNHPFVLSRTTALAYVQVTAHLQITPTIGNSNQRLDRGMRPGARSIISTYLLAFVVS